MRALLDEPLEQLSVTRLARHHRRAVTAIWYEIRVDGLVPAGVLEELDGVKATVQPIATILRGPVTDQSALHGIINRLQGVGLDLVEVRRLPGHPVDEQT